mmetsp:Transcript_3488/g.6599  ORF Transcript_3488/g.6599 Transcript_3488/m.6599 type:complete len:437 (-) Transcript_3488:48-1358(-)
MSDHATLPKSHCSVTPQNTSAFHSLFRSVTRPVPLSSGSNNSFAPYFILFQHTRHFSQRLIAAEPDSTSQVYRNAGLLTPKETSIKDSRGDLFVKEAWRECVNGCSGKVILVKCSDSLDFGFESGGGGNHTQDERNDNAYNMFVENGVLIDLSCDPLDWDSDSSNNDEKQDGVHTIKGGMCDLNSILLALQNAATHIASTSRSSSGSTCTTHPVPIIFDSFTPLVLYHGVEKVHILLTALKQSQTKKKTTSTAFLSPIFAPVLSEIIPPSGNRILEDYADAVMTLYGGKLSIAKRSARNGGMVSCGLSGGLRLVKEVQHFELKDLAWNELVLIKGDKQDIGNVTQKRNDSEVDASVQDVIEKTEKIKIHATKEKGKVRPTLMHENDDEGSSSLQQLQQQQDKEREQRKPKPVIYLEENDPEFQDLDEEDPDDDLDI